MLFAFLPHCLPGWRELPAIFSGSSLYRAGISTVAGTHKTEIAAIYRTGGRCRGAASFGGIEVTALGSVISVQAHQRTTSSFRSLFSQSQQASPQQVNKNPHSLLSIITTPNQFPQVPKQGVCQGPHAASFLGAPLNQLPRALRYSRLLSWLESICAAST